MLNRLHDFNSCVPYLWGLIVVVSVVLALVIEYRLFFDKIKVGKISFYKTMAIVLLYAAGAMAAVFLIF